MALTIEEVRKIASLARLRLSPEQETALEGQLGKIVDYIDQLAGFAPAPVELATGSGREAGDQPRACLPRARFLANAPASLDGFLLVPEIKATEND
jgi:aspartyl-tRNA(Asn)/glutamyl-tRNA(Gln) amidotransferase subunit C